MTASKQRIDRAVTASGTLLTNIVGVGPIGATTIIGYTKNVSRFPTRNHYATYNVTAPIDVFSAGNTKQQFNL